MIEKNNNELIHDIAKKIEEKGGKLYYVGGYVRDKKIGIQNKDIDVEIYGINVKEINEILSQFGNVDLVGALFGIYKIHGVDIDFCLPRRETLVGKGHKDFEVSVDPYITTEEAAKRRDFTINSIMQDVNTGEFIDHFDGIGDLERKNIKHIDDKTFIEDPLRVLRACQFAARLEFDIDEKTVDLCKTLDISSLPKERIYEEVRKGILKAKKPSIFLQKLKQVEKLNDILPCDNIDDENMQKLYELVDRCAEHKHDSNNPEYFMFASLAYGVKSVDENIDVNELLSRLTKKKDFIASIENLVSEELELEKRQTNENDISNYELKKIAMKSKDKYNIFNIDDLILLNKLSEDKEDKRKVKNSVIKSQLEDIDLNDQRTIDKKYTGDYLKRLGVPVGKVYNSILDNAFDMQLQDIDDDNIQKYLRNRAKEEIVKSITNKIEKEGGNCYFFGGYVRDKIIGKLPNDMDIQIIGLDNSKVQNIIGQYGEVLVAGKAFPILKLKTGIDIDFLSPEDKDGNLLSVEDAQRRIDFTMNTVFENVTNGQQIDNFNGIEDIKQKIIKMTDKNSFSTDEVRSLRACRFASELGFSISPDTVEECKKFNFESIPKSRIYAEVEKTLLRSKEPSIFFNELQNMGIIEKLFSPMDKLIGLEQEEKFHPEGDVWKHTMKVLDFAAGMREQAENKLSFMMGALCHDFGKISKTQKIVDNNGNERIISYGHDVAVDESKQFFKNLNVPKKVASEAIALQVTHMRPDVLYRENSKLVSINKMINDSQNQLNDLLLLSDCDRLGSGVIVSDEKKKYIKERKLWWKEKESELKEKELYSSIETLSGKELIALGFKPGPLFSVIQNESKVLFLEGKTKQEVENYVLEKYGRKISKTDIENVVKDVSIEDIEKLFDNLDNKRDLKEI